MLMVLAPSPPRMPFSLSKKPLFLTVRLLPSVRMPAPFWSGTLESRNSMLSITTLEPAITQVALPCALLPSANKRARPPTPQIVRLLADHVVTSPR